MWALKHGGFYRAYKTKAEALADRERVRKLVRREMGVFSVNIVISHIKHFYSDGRPAWAMYVYKRK